MEKTKPGLEERDECSDTVEGEAAGAKVLKLRFSAASVACMLMAD